MTLSLLGTTAGPLIATALATPLGTANWTAVLTQLANFLVTNTVILPGLMVAASSAVTGLGFITITGSANTLGLNMAIAAGSPPTDTVAITLWTAVANAIITDMTNNAKAFPITFVAIPTGGPIAGTGLIIFPVPLLGAALAQAVNCTDAVGIADWQLVGTIIEEQIAALTIVLATPIGMTSPPGGGPVLGAGTIL
jgi:hypothetical protein